MATKTIAFTVYDGNETLPGANIAIDGIATAQTNGNGYVVIQNVSTTATVQISFIGYEDYIISAAAVPSKVILNSGVEQLPELVITRPKTQKSNDWMWYILGAVGVIGVIKNSKSGAKIVKGAKI